MFNLPYIRPQQMGHFSLDLLSRLSMCGFAIALGDGCEAQLCPSHCAFCRQLISSCGEQAQTCRDSGLLYSYNMSCSTFLCSNACASYKCHLDCDAPDRLHYTGPVLRSCTAHSLWAANVSHHLLLGWHRARLELCS